MNIAEWKCLAEESRRFRRDIKHALDSIRAHNTRGRVAAYRQAHPEATARDAVIAQLAELESVFGRTPQPDEEARSR